MKTNKQFENIRQWANERNLIKEGDIKTQALKLTEEVGELSDAILRNDQLDIIDAIGDSVVVLTNLAAIAGFKIEDCIEFSWKQIKDRKGKMDNGTFKKE